jgi:propanol-preferring alcohol dehydrogenase
MAAMVLDRPGTPLRMTRLPLRQPGEQEVLIRVGACGVCRTDLHILDGELPQRRSPVVPGHEIVGQVVAAGPLVRDIAIGDRVGVPWLGHTCGACPYCLAQRENLCDAPGFTGYDRDGGYAEYTIADARYCFHLPDSIDDLHAAPLLCAGLIGFRAYRMAQDAQRIGLYGFGAAAHIIAQFALQQGREVFAFTRPGDTRSQDFARSLGVGWAGDADVMPPGGLDAAIIFAPVGALVPQALAACRKGGVVVCAGIHMSDIPGFPYALLWQERSIRSVANLTREDGIAFFKAIAVMDIRTFPMPFPLGQANEALEALRRGAFDGAAVLLP